MFEAMKSDQWDHLLSPRDGLLDAAIRMFWAAGASAEALQEIQAFWDTFTSPEFRAGLDECCFPHPEFPFPKADPNRLFDNARSRFASGVAVGLLSHLDRGPQIAEILRAWLGRAALLPPTQHIGFTADLLSIPWSHNQEHRLAQLSTLIPQDARFDAWRVQLHLHHWLHPKDLFPPNPQHRLRVPVAAVSGDHRQGFVFDLLLAWLPSGKPRLIEHPVVWNLPIVDDWLQVLRDAHQEFVFPSPVVWGLNLADRPVLEGDSHTVAARVAWRVLWEKGDYDTGCLLAATLNDNTPNNLDGVFGLDKKCQAAQAAGINRVVIAKTFTPPRPEISPAVADKLSGDARQPVVIHRLETLEAAYEEATGLARGMRMYLTWVANRMDEASPAYLGPDRNGDRRLLSRYYIEPDILMTEIRKTGREDEQANTVPLPISAGSEAEEITTFRHRQVEEERRAAWQREWPKLQARSRVAIVALPGEGKTLLTQMTVRALANRALSELRDQSTPAAKVILPVWLRLRDVVTHGSIQKALCHSLQDALPNLPEVARKHLDQHLTSETTWLFLDALDEVSESSRPDLYATLRHELNIRDEASSAGDSLGMPQPCRVILTSRPWGFTPEQLPFRQLVKFQLAPLNVRQRNRFVRMWFEQSAKPERETAVLALIQNNPSLVEVARTPLLLTLTCSVADDHALDPEQVRRVVLYKLAIRKILRGEGKPEKAISEERVEDHFLLLAEAAWALFRPDPATTAFTLNQWYSALERAGVARSDRACFFERCRNVGLLIPMGENKLKDRLFGMPHRSFFEFLAAWHLSATGAVQDQIAPFLWQPSPDPAKTDVWKPEAFEFLTFLAGTMANPVPLLEWLERLDHEKPDLLHRMLLLAGACIREADVSVCMTPVAVRLADKARTKYEEHKRNRVFLGHLRNPAVSTRLRRDLALETDSWKKRQLIYVLGELHCVAAIPDLLGYLQSDDQELAHDAAEALGTISSSAVIPSLVATLRREETWVARAAARALGWIGNEDIVPDLIGALEHPDKHLFGDAATALGKIGDARGITPLIRQLDRRRDPIPITVAIDALAEHRHPATDAAILPHLNHEDRWVCKSAIKAVVQIGSLEAVSELLTLLGHDHTIPRGDSAEALGKLGVQEAVPNLLPLLADKDKFVCLAAATSLRLLGNKDYFDILVRGLSHAEDERREHSAFVLGRLSEHRAVDALIQCLSDKCSSVRTHAAQALGALGNRKAIAPLRQVLLTDPIQLFTRCQAATSLGKIGGKEAFAVLHDAYAQPDMNPETRSDICSAIGMIQEADVVPFLRECIGDKSKNIQRAAFDALTKRGEFLVVGILIESIKDTALNRHIKEICHSADYSVMSFLHSRFRLDPGLMLRIH